MLKMFLLLIILAVVSFYNIPCLGQEAAIGIGASFAAPNKNLDAGAGLHGHLDIIIPNFSLIFRTEGGWYKAKTTSDPSEDTDLFPGDYSLKWIEETMILFNPTTKESQPFAGLGVGYYFYDYSYSDAFTQSLLSNDPPLTAKAKISNGLGLHAKGGLNIIVMPAILLKLELKYIHINADFRQELFETSNSSSADVEEKKINLSTFFVVAGIIIALP